MGAFGVGVEICLKRVVLTWTSPKRRGYFKRDVRALSGRHSAQDCRRLVWNVLRHCGHRIQPSRISPCAVQAHKQRAFRDVFCFGWAGGWVAGWVQAGHVVAAEYTPRGSPQLVDIPIHLPRISATSVQMRQHGPQFEYVRLMTRRL